MPFKVSSPQSFTYQLHLHIQGLKDYKSRDKQH